MCQGILECEVLVGTRSAEGIMASGHVNRIKRPNTWLHRPMLQNREESSCQTGAVHTWPLAGIEVAQAGVRGFQHLLDACCHLSLTKSERMIVTLFWRELRPVRSASPP
jgi:hypothetical protein